MSSVGMWPPHICVHTQLQCLAAHQAMGPVLLEFLYVYYIYDSKYITIYCYSALPTAQLPTNPAPRAHLILRMQVYIYCSATFPHVNKSAEPYPHPHASRVHRYPVVHDI